MSDASISSINPEGKNTENGEEEDENESDTISGPNPYEQFNDLFVNDLFLKSNSIMQFTKSLQKSVIDELAVIADREDFIKYVEAVFRHLRLNPQKFVFFVSRPEPSDKEERELVLIKSDRKVYCVRQKSTYLLKGHVAHIFFKNQSRVQITTSKGLFMKLTLWKDLKNLKTVIPDFLNLSTIPAKHSAEELFFRSMMDLPNKFNEMNHLLKNSFLSLFLTANLEFCRKLSISEIKEENLITLSEDIMVIFQKAHLWDHLMRTIIPLYIEKQVNRVETIMVDKNVYLVPCLLHLCRIYYGQKFLPQVCKVLYPVICKKSIDENVISTFVKLIIKMNFPTQILLIATELYKAVKNKFPDDEYAAPSVVGSFLITDFIFPEIFSSIVDKTAKNRYHIFLNVLTFNSDFSEGEHFHDIIKKLYISLGESEVIVTKAVSVEKSAFSYHISHLFNYFLENASYLYNQFSHIDLSNEKSPVYNEIMELFGYVDKLQNEGKLENDEDYNKQLAKDLNQILKKFKNGKIKIRRTDKKEIKRIIKKQKQEKKVLLAEIKSKKKKPKQSKLDEKEINLSENEYSISSKSQNDVKSGSQSDHVHTEPDNPENKTNSDSGSKPKETPENVTNSDSGSKPKETPENVTNSDSGSKPKETPENKTQSKIKFRDTPISDDEEDTKKDEEEKAETKKSSKKEATKKEEATIKSDGDEDLIKTDATVTVKPQMKPIFHNVRKPKGNIMKI